MSFFGFLHKLRQSFTCRHVVGFDVVYFGDLVHFFNNTIILIINYNTNHPKNEEILKTPSATPKIRIKI